MTQHRVRHHRHKPLEPDFTNPFAQERPERIDDREWMHVRVQG
jgi:hypothetical protein